MPSKGYSVSGGLLERMVLRVYWSFYFLLNPPEEPDAPHVTIEEVEDLKELGAEEYTPHATSYAGEDMRLHMDVADNVLDVKVYETGDGRYKLYPVYGGWMMNKLEEAVSSLKGKLIGAGISHETSD